MIFGNNLYFHANHEVFSNQDLESLQSPPEFVDRCLKLVSNYNCKVNNVH